MTFGGAWVAVKFVSVGLPKARRELILLRPARFTRADKARLIKWKGPRQTGRVWWEFIKPKICTFSDLRGKEVINTNEGKRLGYVCDLEIDLSCGKIVSIIVPGELRHFGFSRGEDFRIPWECIERIGDDIIIVSRHFHISRK